jgi:NAD(P)H-nitrite reductase large subunit/rubredoxin
VKKWRCKICGYIHEGESAPEICPVCGAGPEDFIVLKDILKSSDKVQIKKLIIIGNGAAGIEAARTIRSHASDVDILVLSEESYSFYSRIHLSTFIGDESQIKDITIFPENWYNEQNISVKLNTKITELDYQKKEIRDERGKKYRYDKLILACGASPFFPPLPGLNKKNIFALRNIEDALRIRKAVESCQSAAVIGGGILGIEAAASLNKLGIKTTIIEIAEHLLSLQLDAAAGTVLQRNLEDRGLAIRCGTKIEKVWGDHEVNSLLLDTGEKITANLILVSTGIRPNTDLAVKAGIRTKRGILVDENMRTSQPDIFAAGDVAEYNGNLFGIWPAAVDQGIIAGKNALGISSTYKSTTPLHILKVAGIELTAVGQKSVVQSEDKEIIHQDAKHYQYVKLIHNSHILKGAIVLGIGGIGFRLEKLIKSKSSIEHMLYELEKSNWDILKKKKK